MKKTIRIFFLQFIVICSFAQKGSVIVSQKEGWHKIGEVNAAFNEDSESIVVLGNDTFKAIKLKVNKAPIHIMAIQLLYESGKIENVSVNADFKMNETNTYSIENKALSKITLIYKTLSHAENDKAEVEIHGLK
jgi:hypothetical protein